jgi:hypothetical protein
MDFTYAACVQLVQRGLKNFWLSETPSDQVQAVTLCRRSCPVRAECMIYAQMVRPTAGIWHGMSYGNPNTEGSDLRKGQSLGSRKALRTLKVVSSSGDIAEKH